MDERKNGVRGIPSSMPGSVGELLEKILKQRGIDFKPSPSGPQADPEDLHKLVAKLSKPCM